MHQATNFLRQKSNRLHGNQTTALEDNVDRKSRTQRTKIRRKNKNSQEDRIVAAIANKTIDNAVIRKAKKVTAVEMGSQEAPEINGEIATSATGTILDLGTTTGRAVTREVNEEVILEAHETGAIGTANIERVGKIEMEETATVAARGMGETVAREMGETAARGMVETAAREMMETAPQEMVETVPLEMGGTATVTVIHDPSVTGLAVVAVAHAHEAILTSEELRARMGSAGPRKPAVSPQFECN